MRGAGGKVRATFCELLYAAWIPVEIGGFVTLQRAVRRADVIARHSIVSSACDARATRDAALTLDTKMSFVIDADIWDMF